MASLRPRGADDLGLRHALSDRLLPLLVMAMVFLAALALAGAVAASALATHWQGGPAALLTIQVPDPGAAEADGVSRADRVAALLKATPALSARRLTEADLDAVLRPWLADQSGALSLALPAVFEVRLSAAEPHDLAGTLDKAVPGTLVERNGVWFDRLAALARSLQASAALALVVVTLVAVAVVAVATRAGLAARRDAIDIVHGLGATDATIAGAFARRVTLLVFAGAVLGLGLAVPLLLGLATLTAPFQPGMPQAASPADLLQSLPPLLWAGLPVLPVGAAAIGWLTAQTTVRLWLARSP